ncbi:MAG: Type secretory pathway, component PulF [Capsulimonas sp.]|jgi:type II secretory pathway component PulF|nr:Type secretory pathway, component PulF [Capsulimonas sp.]
MLYSYEAKDSQGKRVSGTVEAPDERGAARHVQAEGYFLMRLIAAPVPAGAGPGPAPAGEMRLSSRSADMPIPPPPPLSPGKWLLSKLIYPIWTGVSLRDLSILYRQFATLVDAGVPLQRSVATMQAQTYNRTLRKCLNTIAMRVNAGGTISEAMAEYPWIFPDYQRASIIAGEAIGNIDVQFRRLAQTLEEEHQLRGTIKREMFRPCVNITAMFLFPPLVLLFLGQVHAYFVEAVYPLLETIGFILGCYILGRLATGFRWFYDAVLSILPWIGGAVRMIAFARFGRTLASMYSAGVNIVRAIHYSTEACGNTYLAGRMESIGTALQAGGGITEAFHRTGIFPPMVISMMGTGEESGNLDTMMDKMASFYEEEAKFKLHQVSMSLGAITTVAVGIRVAIIVIKFYTGYFGSIMQEAG